MTVRNARLEDVSSIVELWKEFMAEHDELVFKENPQIEPYIRKYLKKRENAASLFKAFIQENIRSDDALVLITEVEGEPVRFSLALIQNTIPIFVVEKIGAISDLFIKKSFRGRGLSSQLKNETIKWLKKKNIAHATITVYADNKHAREIYKEWDFQDFQVVLRRAI